MKKKNKQTACGWYSSCPQGFSCTHRRSEFLSTIFPVPGSTSTFNIPSPWSYSKREEGIQMSLNDSSSLFSLVKRSHWSLQCLMLWVKHFNPWVACCRDTPEDTARLKCLLRRIICRLNVNWCFNVTLDSSPRVAFFVLGPFTMLLLPEFPSSL